MTARKRETGPVTEDARGPHDIGDADDDATPFPLASTAAISEPAKPESLGLIDEVERQRVQQALFGGTSQSFELGRYVVTGTLGRGGMGVVFRAFDPELDRRVALKVLHAELDRAHTTRLRREAQAMAKLSHPNVVQVYEVGQVEGQTFVAMELVEGQTLKEWMNREPRPSWRESVEVFIQVGTGLAAAHEQGLIHRDFKPGNAIIDDKGRPRVLDFGLARQAGDVEDAGERDVPVSVQRARTEQRKAAPLDESLTNTGAVLGTPAYMPPEQMKGEPTDARSDQFSFCIALYEALYGERPFEGQSMVALMYTMVRGDLRPPPKGNTVPKTLRDIVLRGLSTQPEDRWPSMETLLEQLRRLLAPRARRGLVVGLTLGLGALGATLAVPQFLAMQERCSGARAQLEGIWDDARRQQVEQAILGTKRSYATSTWHVIAPRLDDYADAWARRHTEVCEATTVRHEQTAEAMSLRMACLHEHRTSLRATVEVLAQANPDGQTIDNALDLVAELPTMTRCDDVERLSRQRQRMPPAEDPQVAEQVQQLRDQLAHIEMMGKAGKYAEALTLLEPVLEQADALGYGPVQAEATLQHGVLLEDHGQYAESERQYERAHALALEHEHTQVELEAAQSLTHVVGVLLARPDEGDKWGQTALALARRSDEDLELAMSLNNLGLVLQSRGEYEAAKDHFEQVLELREKALGPDDRHVAYALDNLGLVWSNLGDYEQAQTLQERALQIVETTLGPDHPAVAAILGNVASALYAQGKYDEALEHERRALSIRETALGSDHPEVATSLGNLANVFYSRGDLEQALRHYQRAVQIDDKALGDDHPTTALHLTNLAGVYHARGEYARARPYYLRALEIYGKTLGPEHPDVGMIHGNLGNGFLGDADHERAELHLQKGRQILERSLGADHPDVAHNLGVIGAVFLAKEDYEQAKVYTERALRIWEKALGPDHPILAYPHVALARATLELGDATAARAHAERGLSIHEASGSPPVPVAQARFELAAALWSDEADRPRARKLAEQARDALADAGIHSELEVVEDWLATHRVR